MSIVSNATGAPIRIDAALLSVKNAKGQPLAAPFFRIFGAACPTRTGHPIITNDVLYQMS